MRSRAHAGGARHDPARHARRARVVDGPGHPGDRRFGRFHHAGRRQPHRAQPRLLLARGARRVRQPCAQLRAAGAVKFLTTSVIIGAVIGGLVAWTVVATLLNLALRLAWPPYATVEKAMTFTLGMQLARLVIGAVASLAAGFTTAWISR